MILEEMMAAASSAVRPHSASVPAGLMCLMIGQDLSEAEGERERGKGVRRRGGIQQDSVCAAHAWVGMMGRGGRGGGEVWRSR